MRLVFVALFDASPSYRHYESVDLLRIFENVVDFFHQCAVKLRVGSSSLVYMRQYLVLDSVGLANDCHLSIERKMIEVMAKTWRELERI